MLWQVGSRYRLFLLRCYIATSLQCGYEIPEGERPLQHYLHCSTESVKAETARMWEVSCNKNPTPWMNSEESGLRVSSLNCRSLRKHIEDVKTDDLLLRADVIALQETWLEKGEDEQGPYQLEGYRAIFASAGRGKGLVTYVKGDIHLIQTVQTDDLQICKITMEKEDVFNIYRSQEEPLSRVKDVLLPLMEPGKETILVGDFNFCATEKNQLSDALEKAGLIQLVSMPTHIQGGNEGELNSPVKLNLHLSPQVPSTMPIFDATAA